METSCRLLRRCTGIALEIALFTVCFAGSVSAQNELKTYTPQGSEVALEYKFGILTPAEKAARKEYCTKTYPRAIYIDEATYAYNCHAYAWSVSEGGEKYWMNTPNDDLYWLDGSYVATNSSDPKATKVSYANDDHSAIVSSPGPYLISKWGPLCLMKHLPADCPYNSKGLRYYKLSMEISGDQVIALPDNTSSVSREYRLSNVPIGATVEWAATGSKATIVNGQGSNAIQVSFTGSADRFVSAKVHCPTGLIVKIPFDLHVITSSAPIITDITTIQYGSTLLLHAISNQPEGNFVWSVDNSNVTLYENPYPDDASFMHASNTFKAVRTSIPGSYTFTVTGESEDLRDIYTFSKTIYLDATN